MITTKQRSYLRSLANKLTPIFQVGKGGIEDNFLKQINETLDTRELIKIKTLSNSGITAREASEIICEELRCEGIQAIGSTVVIYRQSRKNPVIDLENLTIITKEKVVESKKQIMIRKSEKRNEQRRAEFRNKQASKRSKKK